LNKANHKCVYAGTFDPFTLGHEHVVNECLKMFDEVVVAILVNKGKQPMFSAEERKDIINIVYGGNPAVKVLFWDGLAVDLLRSEGTSVYVRGIRNSTDFDYENADMYASKKLYGDLTEVYIPCPQELLHVSSTIVKNALKFSSPLDGYVSPAVKAYLLNAYKNKTKD